MFLAKNEDYAQRLEAAIRAKYPDEDVQNLILDAPFPVPPFAAAVFLKTKGDRARIWDEVRSLRNQLKPVRTALSMLQRERNTADYSGLITLFGVPHSDDSKLRLDDRVRDALDTLRDLKLPLPKQVLVLKPIYDIVKAAASLLVQPIESSSELFQKARELSELRSKGKELQLWGDRSTFAEVHYQLGWKLRSWLNEGVKLGDLFGPIQDDVPRRNSK